MSPDSLLNLVILVAVVVWFGVRRLAWGALDTHRLLRTPAVMCVVGVGLLITDSGIGALTVLDIGLLVVEGVVAIAFGAVVGMITEFRPISDEVRAAHMSSRKAASDHPLPTLQSRTPLLGLVLWLLFIAIRIAVGIWSTQHGSVAGSMTGTILIMLALNRGSSALVVARRLGAPARLAS